MSSLGTRVLEMPPRAGFCHRMCCARALSEKCVCPAHWDGQVGAHLAAPPAAPARTSTPRSTAGLHPHPQRTEDQQPPTTTTARLHRRGPTLSPDLASHAHERTRSPGRGVQRRRCTDDVPPHTEIATASGMLLSHASTPPCSLAESTQRPAAHRRLACARHGGSRRRRRRHR